MKDFEILLNKFLDKTLTKEEERQLIKLIDDPKKKNYYRNFLKSNFLIDSLLIDGSKENTKKVLLEQIRKEKSISDRFKVKNIFKYAAAIAFLIVGSYLVNQNFLQKSDVVNSSKNNPSITITLENGEKQLIDENGNVILKNKQGKIIGKQEGELLDYSKREADNNIAYNTISIPRGKRFKLKLSDGTLIHINAESSLTYPVNFRNGIQRQVTLEGEAFFEVAKGIDPFIVITGNLNTEVLGTSFNVSSFNGTSKTEVVLVEGSVELTAKGKDKTSQTTNVLEPGFKGTFISSSDGIKISEVDVTLFTSWTNGVLIFNNSSFDEVMTKLSRYYDVTFINNNQNLSKEKFNARINFEKENISKVMSYFKKVHPMDYEIEGKKILIKQ